MPCRIATSSDSRSRRAARRRMRSSRRPGSRGSRKPLATSTLLQVRVERLEIGARRARARRPVGHAESLGGERELVAGHLHGRGQVERRVLRARRNRRVALAGEELVVGKARGLVAEHEGDGPGGGRGDDFRRERTPLARGVRKVAPARAEAHGEHAVGERLGEARAPRARDPGRRRRRPRGHRRRDAESGAARRGRGPRAPWSSWRARPRRCCRGGSSARAPRPPAERGFSAFIV